MAARSRRSALAIGLLFLLTSVFTLAAPVATFGWSGGTFSSTSESDLVAMTNRARASAGLKALKVDSTLHSVARWRSKDMIDRNYFSHSIPGYGKVWDKLNAIGYCYNVAGENIGWNNYPDDSRDRRHPAAPSWTRPGHRANIMGKTWDVIGIGAYKGSSGKKMWTVLFADKCGSTAPKPTPKPTPEADRTADPAGRPRSPPPGRRRDRPEGGPRRDARAHPGTDARARAGGHVAGRQPDLPRAGRIGRRAVGADLDPAGRSRRGGRAPRRRSPDIGWTARNDRRRSGRLLLRRWMMTVATRAPQRATPDPAPADRDVAQASSEASSPMPIILEAHDLTKSYPLGSTVVEALRGVSLTVAGRRVRRPDGAVGLGQVHAAPGPRRPRPADHRRGRSSRARRSASCRTTGRPGCAAIGPASSSSPSTSSRCSTRPRTSACRSRSPARIRPAASCAERVRDAIGLVDLIGKEHHKPDQLSAGEQQRVAIARALVTRPALLFADEPTGNLDYTTGTEILDALWRSCVERGQTVVLVTHDSKAAAYADRVLVIGDGRIRETIELGRRDSHDATPLIARLARLGL